MRIPRIGRKLARSETLRTKPSFRVAFNLPALLGGRIL